MYKKYIISVLIPSLIIQLCGCYSMREINKEEITETNEGRDLIVHTKDSTIYFFKKSNYHILNDSLYGKGYAKFMGTSDFKAINEDTLALVNINSLERDELNPVKTGFLIGGILLVITVVVLIITKSNSNQAISIEVHPSN
jgi:hypothetical protein